MELIWVIFTQNIIFHITNLMFVCFICTYLSHENFSSALHILQQNINHNMRRTWNGTLLRLNDLYYNNNNSNLQTRSSYKIMHTYIYSANCRGPLRSFSVKIFYLFVALGYKESLAAAFGPQQIFSWLK